MTDAVPPASLPSRLRPLPPPPSPLPPLTPDTLAGDVRALLRAAGALLAGVSDSPRLDAELLLARALDWPRSRLFGWPEHTPEPARLAAFGALLRRRLRGEPLAYITGEREFWSLPLTVSPAVLVPRPATETLVEAALGRLPPARRAAVADLGTGSGAVAIALASERPRVRVLATERSRAALAIARDNARHLPAGPAGAIRFRRGDDDWYAPLRHRRFDLLVSNPPYIAAGSRYLRQHTLRREPRQALSAGPDGLRDLRALAAGAGRHLRHRGWLMLEHGYDQSRAVRRLLRRAGLVRIACYRDAAGRGRVSIGQWRR